MNKSLWNIFWLGTKEVRSLLRDTAMLILVAYAFSLAIYVKSTSLSGDVNNAAIAIVDEDQSSLSGDIIKGFYPPYFQTADLIDISHVDEAMDRGKYMFVLLIPNGMEANLRRGRRTEIQLNVDATAASQANLGASYISSIIEDAVLDYIDMHGTQERLALVTRRAFNPHAEVLWFQAVAGFLDNITLVIIILTGAALLREREHGTIEHLMVMPLTSFQIAMAKIAANGLAILLVATVSLIAVVRGILGVPIAGSVPFFLLGTLIYLFAAASVGVLLGTMARSMAQFSLLVIMVLIPMQMLSGGMTPVADQPEWLQMFTWFLPSRHFMSFSQSVIYRGAGLETVWASFFTMVFLGIVYLTVSLALFRRSMEAG